MKPFSRRSVLLSAVTLASTHPAARLRASAAAAPAQAPATPLTCAAAASTDAAIVARLQAMLLPELAKALQPALRGYAETLLTSADGEARAAAGHRLAGEPEALELVLAWLTRDHPVDETQFTMMNLWGYPHSAADARTRAVFRHLIATSPEPVLVNEAAHQWRSLAVRDLHDTVAARVAAARASGPETLHEALMPLEDWARNLRAGTMLPAFLRRAPALITTPFTGQRVRLLGFGDFGTGSNAQRDVAGQMRRAHAAVPFDFGITLGDNFYPRGLSTLDDPRWQTQFEELYGPMGITIYASLGNHDRMYAPDSAIAEILKTRPGGRWQLPSSFYTFTAGPAQFFAIDTIELSDLQLEWLRKALDASTARWKIVYGHYPLVVARPNYLTAEGETGERVRRRLARFSEDERKAYQRIMSGETPDMVDRLLPVLRGRADVYLAGHHHSLQHLRPIDGVHLFIIGGGGASSYDVAENHPRAIFGRQVYGFASMAVSPAAFSLAFVDQEGTEVYKTTIDK